MTVLKRLREDIIKANQILEQKIEGLKIEAFSYPFGDDGKDSINIKKDLAKEINSKISDDYFAFTFINESLEKSRTFVLKRINKNYLSLNRFMINEAYSSQKLITVIEKKKLLGGK